jgi:hypothetical protein
VGTNENTSEIEARTVPKSTRKGRKMGLGTYFSNFFHFKVSIYFRWLPTPKKAIGLTEVLKSSLPADLLGKPGYALHGSQINAGNIEGIRYEPSDSRASFSRLAPQLCGPVCRDSARGG